MVNDTDIPIPINARIKFVSSSVDHHIRTQYVISVMDERNQLNQWTVYHSYSGFRSFYLKIVAAIQECQLCSNCMNLKHESIIKQFPRRHLWRSRKKDVLLQREIKLNQFLNRITSYSKLCFRPTQCILHGLLENFLLVSCMRYTCLDINREKTTLESASNSDNNSEKSKDNLPDIKTISQIKLERKGSPMIPMAFDLSHPKLSSTFNRFQPSIVKEETSVLSSHFSDLTMNAPSSIAINQYTKFQKKKRRPLQTHHSAFKKITLKRIKREKERKLENERYIKYFSKIQQFTPLSTIHEVPSH